MAPPSIPESSDLGRAARSALAVIAPLIAAFFVGSWALAVAAVCAAWVPRACAALALLSPLVVAVGAAPVEGSARLAGLLFLACILASQAWIGLALRSRPPGR
jgi:hypothetical protein